MAIDQSARYVDLTMKEEELMREGNHLLAAYRLKPKPGYGFTATAAHVAAESSTGTNVEVKTTDDFTRGIDAKVYFIDENYFGDAGGLIKIAYPYELFDHNITDGRLMVANVMTLIVGNNQGMGDIVSLRMLDFWVPPRMLVLFDGPSTTIHDIWRAMGRDYENGGAIVGTIIKPKLGLRPQPFADACYEFWLGGDFIKNDEPQGNQPFCPLKKVIPLVADAMKRAQDETGEAKVFSANITADDPFEMIARGEFILETFGEDANRVMFLVDGFVAGVTAVSLARRYFPNVYLHYHRAGHGAITSEVNPRGYPAFVHCKLARLAGASGIHTGTMGFGKMEGSKDDRIIEYMIRNEEAEGPFFRQKWYGMKPTAAHISGGMNAVRIPAFCDNLGHDSFCLTAGGGAFGHLDGGTAGAISLRQAFEAWRQGIDLVEYAKEHRELARAFESFPHDADQYYPGWRQKLGIAA